MERLDGRFFTSMGRVGVGEAMDSREERGGEQSAGMLAVWRQGGARYVVVRSFGAVTSCIEVRDGRGEIEMG